MNCKMNYTKRDSGYAWVILCMSYLHNLLNGSLMISPAVYMVDWSEQFQSTKTEIGFVGSAYTAVACITGLFLGPLIDRYGCRTVTILGTIIMLTGLISTCFASSLYWIYVSYCFIAGIGLGIQFIPPLLMVQYYFDKKRPFASGISLAGHSSGAFIFTPLVRLLVNTYGWKGAILIHSGIAMHIFIAGSLYRPPILKELQENKMIGEENITDIEKKNSAAGCFQSCLITFRNKWDITLFKEITFAIFFVCQVSSVFQGELMYKFTPLKAISKGILSKTQASFLPSVIGFSSSVARLIVSFIANLPCINRAILVGMAILCGGMATVASCFAWDFISLAVFSGIYGLTLGTHMTIYITLMVDLIGLKRLAQGQSFMMGGSGLAVIISLTLAGYIVDRTGNYDTPYYIYGSMCILAALSMFTIPCLTRRENTANLESNGTVTTERTAPTNIVNQNNINHISMQSLTGLT